MRDLFHIWIISVLTSNWIFSFNSHKIPQILRGGEIWGSRSDALALYNFNFVLYIDFQKLKRHGWCVITFQMSGDFGEMSEKRLQQKARLRSHPLCRRRKRVRKWLTTSHEDMKLISERKFCTLLGVLKETIFLILNPISILHLMYKRQSLLIPALL
jgi:hypothetical protein